MSQDGHQPLKLIVKEREAERHMEEGTEKEKMKVGLRREDTLCQSMWIVGINQIATGHPHILGILLSFKHLSLSYYIYKIVYRSMRIHERNTLMYGNTY